jgi:hypothetical protein
MPHRPQVDAVLHFVHQFALEEGPPRRSISSYSGALLTRTMIWPLRSLCAGMAPWCLVYAGVYFAIPTQLMMHSRRLSWRLRVGRRRSGNKRPCPVGYTGWPTA